jgi:diguanylate cyclase (GGDEF)-like protein
VLTTDREKRRWLIEFALVSLIPIVLLGLLIGQALRSGVRDRQEASARSEVQIVNKIGFEQELGPNTDLSRALTSDQQAALDRAISSVRAQSDVKRVILRDRSGRIAWSDDHALIGQTNNPNEARAASFGKTVSVITDFSKNPADTMATLGQVMQVYVPVRLTRDGPPAGTNELWLPYQPIASAVKRESRNLYVMVGGGLLVIWALLIAIVAGASQRLRRQAAEKEEQALSDALTGLPNRTLFQNLVQRTIAGAGRRRKLAAVMLMDLDRFKDVNDTLGHHNGDLLLQRIGSRLHSVLREGESVARLGGDEFAILLPDVPDRQAIVPVVRRVLKVLEEPVVVGGLALQCEASVGIALFPEHGNTVEGIMRAADVAMYVTKENRSGYEFYDAVQHEHRHDAGRLALIGELRRAMDETELVLYYQPKIDLQTGHVKGVEALARWHHPERGLLAPDEFIPLAERSNLLRPMTLYLLDSALRQCNAWRMRGLEVSVAVNLSMQNLLDLRLPNDLARLLTSWRLPPGSLELEITESTIMADHRRATTILTRLNKMGVTLTIDDFGTGYSSLAYLQQLPVSTIKIDKSFVLNMAKDPGNATIVQSTIDLGRNLGLKVIAEGVENEESYRKLAALGCDYAQGFFFSKPISPEKTTVWLEVFDQPASEPLAPTNERSYGEWALEAPAAPQPS